MNLTPATNEQKRALLEGNLNQAARLLFPRDQPLTVLFNLTMVWAFAAICTLVIPVILVAIMAIGLALMPIMILRALMRPKKAIVRAPHPATIQAAEVERRFRAVIRHELRK